MPEDQPQASKHYPKSLYKDGDRNAEHKIVNDAGEERAARADGFKMIDKEHDAKSVAAIDDSAPEPAAAPTQKAPTAKPAKKKK